MYKNLITNCSEFIARNTWDFKILEIPLPSDIIQTLIYGWSWRWLMINHDFMCRLEPTQYIIPTKKRYCGSVGKNNCPVAIKGVIILNDCVSNDVMMNSDIIRTLFMTGNIHYLQD